MNYKANVRPLNKAKNNFVKWMKENNAEELDNDKPEVSERWDYYCTISGFVKDVLYTVYFTCWQGEIKIDYSDDENSYNDLSVEDFNNLGFK